MIASRQSVLAATALGLAMLARTALPAAAAEVHTATGPVEIADRPETIAVYDIAAIDTLHALGVPVAGVPDRLYLPELAGLAASAEPVGTLFEPDLEALNALAPDLVIVGGRSSPQAAHTARVAQTIDMTIDGESLLDETRRRITDYGVLFGKADAAAGLVAALDAEAAAVTAGAEGKGGALIVMTNGPKISVYGPASRFGWIHGELGIAAAADGLDAGQHGDAVSFEFIASTNPDWLIVLDRAAAIGSGEANALATLDNALVRGTTAWREGQVIVLPAADLYIGAGGANATLRVLKALEEGFKGAP